MRTGIRLFCTCLFLMVASIGSAGADLVQFTQVFPGGFNVSINGGAFVPSGPITIVGVVDDAAPDLAAGGFVGEFGVSNLRFSGAGFSNEGVVNSMSLFVWQVDKFAFQRLGETNQGTTGWNGSTSAGPFITDVNSLTTLVGLP
jgi:hypothetical protein